MAANLAEQCLVQELLLSPAVCDLIHSTQPDADTHGDSSFPEGNNDQDSSERIPVALLQLTVQTLLQDCQQRRCTSSDTTLALKGLSDQSPVHLQVHRCALALCVTCTHPSSLIWPYVFYRCILASRCPFFQALFSTSWTEASSEHTTVSTEEVCHSA